MYRKDAVPTSSISTMVVTTNAVSYRYHMSSARGQRLTGFSTQQQPEVTRESTWYPPVVSHPEQPGGYSGPTPVRQTGTWHDNRYVLPAWSTTAAESSRLPYPPPVSSEASGSQFTGYQSAGNQSYGGWYEAERNYPPPPYPVQHYPAERAAFPTAPYTHRSTLPTTTYVPWGAPYGRVAVTHLTSSTITRPTVSTPVDTFLYHTWQKQ